MGYPSLILKIKIVSANTKVTALARIMGSDPRKQPYMSQQATPTVKMEYILSEIPFVSRVFKICST
jgi:hypothetical protein